MIRNRKVAITKPVFESLEGRQLCANTITIFNTATGSSFPNFITKSSDGNIWYSNNLANKVGRMTTAGVSTLFDTPKDVRGLAGGPDGNVWAVSEFGSEIERITPTGSVTTFKIADSFVDPLDITAGPDDAMWFACGLFNKIGRISTTGVIKMFTMPTGVTENGSIVTGPDKALWFTAKNKIGRITTTGTVTSFNLSSAADPTNICKGPDGNIWFVETNNNKIGRIKPASGVVTEFNLPIAASKPTGIAAGADGNLWVTQNIGKIARVTTSGSVTELDLPAPLDKGADLKHIISGPDGNMWFVVAFQNKIGQIAIDTTGGGGGGGGGGVGGGGGGGGGVTIVGSVSGFIFNDKNGDGKHQTTEKGLANFKVFLDKNKNGKRETDEQLALTNSKGAYKFKNVPIASYQVRQILPRNFKRTTKKAFFSINLNLGKNATDEIFGNKKIKA